LELNYFIIITSNIVPALESLLLKSEEDRDWDDGGGKCRGWSTHCEWDFFLFTVYVTSNMGI
jgi:hypothetical protein